MAPRLPGQLRRLNRDARLLQSARVVREWLPGDERYGDPLSTGGERPSEVAGRQLTELTAGSPGVLRELGLGAVQVWQALAEAQGRGRGDQELAIVFTDLTGFSEWALERGDTVAVNLLRDVAEALEPALTAHGGTVVKRLGDGVMAVLAEPQAAVDGVLDARGRVGALEHDGYRPRLRAGLHLGRPRRLGADYLGVDVNVAARLVDGAAPARSWPPRAAGPGRHGAPEDTPQALSGRRARPRASRSSRWRPSPRPARRGRRRPGPEAGRRRPPLGADGWPPVPYADAAGTVVDGSGRRWERRPIAGDAALIDRFYAAFARATARPWPPATRPAPRSPTRSSGPRGAEAGAMWRMLAEPRRRPAHRGARARGQR